MTDFSLESSEDGAHQRREAEHGGLSAAGQYERDTLSALVESITDEVWFADADGNLTLVNPAVWKEFGALSGESVETIAARFEVYRADGTPRPPTEAPPLRALHGEIIRDEEEIVRTPATGELRHRLVSGAPVRARDGAIIGSVCVVRDVTHRVRAEEALRHSEERLRLATAAARIGAFDWDIRTGVNLWTEELEAMYGLAPGEFGNTQPAWEHLIHSDDRATAVALVKGALETGRPVEGEWRVVWPDGSVHWIAGRFQAYKDDAGRPLRLTGVNIDITRQKAVEEALRRSGEDLDRAQAVGQVGSWRLDVRENVLSWSDENHRIFGLPIGTQLTYETFLSVVHPEDRAFVDARWQAALRGEPYDIEHRLLVEGQVKWVRERAFLEHDEAGELLGGFGITQDVTTRRLAEEALRKQEERYRLIVTSSRDSISIQDTDLRYEWVVNPALNLTAEDFIGKTDEDLVDAEQFEAVRALKDQVMRSGEDLEVEVPLTDAHGQVTIWEGRYAPRRDEGGGVTGVYSYFRDVTERKQAEAALLETETEKAAQQERMRLARDLHDSVTQALFAATLKAEALSSASDVEPSLTRQLEEVHRLNRGALAQMRTLLLELRGEPVEEVPIQQLLRNAVEAAESRTSADVVLTLDEKSTLPAKVHEAVYRICQEALNNLVRHAGASSAYVRLDVDESLARLVIGDDGRGFDPASVAPGHFGLISMRERADDSGGEFILKSVVGEGTTLSVDWALEGRAG